MNVLLAVLLTWENRGEDGEQILTSSWTVAPSIHQHSRPKSSEILQCPWIFIQHGRSPFADTATPWNFAFQANKILSIQEAVALGCLGGPVG